MNGIDPARARPDDLKKLRRSIGVAFQDAALFNSMSVEAGHSSMPIWRTSFYRGGAKCVALREMLNSVPVNCTIIAIGIYRY